MKFYSKFQLNSKEGSNHLRRNVCADSFKSFCPSSPFNSKRQMEAVVVGGRGWCDKWGGCRTKALDVRRPPLGLIPRCFFPSFFFFFSPFETERRCQRQRNPTLQHLFDRGFESWSAARRVISPRHKCIKKKKAIYGCFPASFIKFCAPRPGC